MIAPSGPQDVTIKDLWSKDNFPDIFPYQNLYGNLIKKTNDVYVQQPFHCEIEHKLGMTCLTTGPVTCRVRLDRGGYVPGEAINIWATIDNQSKVTVKGTRSCLTEVVSDLLSRVLVFIVSISRPSSTSPRTKSWRRRVESWPLSAAVRSRRALQTTGSQNNSSFLPFLPPTSEAAISSAYNMMCL